MINCKQDVSYHSRHKHNQNTIKHNSVITNLTYGKQVYYYCIV